MVAASEDRKNEGTDTTTSTNLAQIVNYETEIMNWFRTEITKFEEKNFNNSLREFMECSKKYFDDICNLLDDPSKVRAALERFLESKLSTEQDERWQTQNYERENKFTTFATEVDRNWRGRVGERLDELKHRNLEADWTTYQLQSELAEAQNKCKSLESRITQMEKAHELALEENTKQVEGPLQARIDELEANWGARERELIEQKDEAERLCQIAETDFMKERKNAEFLMRECKKSEALCAEINKDLENVKAEKKKVDNALIANESQVSELKEQLHQIQQQNLKMETLKLGLSPAKKHRRMSGISESLNIRLGGHVSDSESGEEGWASSTDSSTELSRLIETKTKTPDDDLYNDYIYSILRQIAHYRANNGFAIDDMSYEAADEKEAVLVALGAILSHFDHGRSTPWGDVNLRQALKDIHLKLVGEQTGLVGSDHDRKIREDVTKRNMDKILEAFDEEYAWRQDQAKQELHEREMLKKERDETRDNLEKAREQLKEYRYPSAKEYNTQHERVLSEVERLEAENKALDNRVSLTKKEKAMESQLEEEIRSLKDNIALLETKKTEVENRNSNYDQVLKEKDEEIEKKKLEIKIWERDCHDHKTVLEQELEKRIKQDILIKENEKQLQEGENIVKELKKETKKLRTDISGLQKALEQNREKLDIANSKLNDTEQTFNETTRFLSSQHQRALEQITKLRADLHKCSATPSSDDSNCTVCKRREDSVAEVRKVALKELKSISKKLGGIIKDTDRQNLIYFPDTSSAGYDTELLRKMDGLKSERDLWQDSFDRERKKVEDLERQFRPLCQDNDPSAEDPFAELPIAYRVEIYKLQRQNQELAEKVKSHSKTKEDLLEALDYGHTLLNFYRRMQQVLEKYREDKNKLVKTPMIHNPSFMVDMDIYLKDDLSKLQKQLLDLLRELPQTPEHDRPARQRQRILLEREVEKYQCILNEIQLHSMLADEVMVISEIYNLDPEAQLVQALLEEHPEYAGSLYDKDVVSHSQVKLNKSKRVAVVQVPTQQPWNWPLYFMLAATALFVFGFIAQQKQKERWSVANNFSRALWVNDKNRGMTFTLTHLALFFLFNMKIFYKGETEVMKWF